MKEILTEQSNRVLLFEQGEDVMVELKSYAKEHQIQSAWINILGACGEVTLAYYDLHAKTYEKHVIREDLEILGVMGNIAQMNGEPALHLHGTFGKRDLSVIGGHIFSMIISAAGETRLQLNEGIIERQFDEKTGLNLMKCLAE
jgi:predicted DNA-binding protein with PD1-like motif